MELYYNAFVYNNVYVIVFLYTTYYSIYVYIIYYNVILDR